MAVKTSTKWKTQSDSRGVRALVAFGGLVERILQPVA